MALHGEKQLIIQGMIVWDGVTQPENNDQGKLVHSLKIACHPQDPDVALLNQLATRCLQESTHFKGVFPSNGCWPIQNCDAAKLEGKLAGLVEFNCKTYNGAPQVFSADGQELNNMVYGPMLYPGAIVQVLLHCYDFNNKSKGVACGLDGIKIINAQAPRLPVGGSNAASAFGASGGAAPGAPAYGAPPAAPGAPAYGAPPAAPGAPAYGAPPAAPAVQPAPQYMAPPPVPGAPAAPVAPVAPAGPVMTAKGNACGFTYQQLCEGGWTEQTLRQEGYIV